MDMKIAEICAQKTGFIAVQLCDLRKVTLRGGISSVKTLAIGRIQKRPRHQRASCHLKLARRYQLSEQPMLGRRCGCRHG
jgi:hypothetical protein